MESGSLKSRREIDPKVLNALLKRVDNSFYGIGLRLDQIGKALKRAPYPREKINIPEEIEVIKKDFEACNALLEEIEIEKEKMVKLYEELRQNTKAEAYARKFLDRKEKMDNFIRELNHLTDEFEKVK